MMSTNLILHTIKYLIATLLVWGAMKASNVGFSFLSCSMVMLALAMLEWKFKVWLIENLESCARHTIQAINNNR